MPTATATSVQAAQTGSELIESDLLRLLDQAARRVKISAALRLICATLLVLLSLGTAMVVASKRWPMIDPFWALGLWSSLSIMFLAGVVGLVRTKPALARMALLLDLRAHLEEHLSTWYDLKLETPQREDSKQNLMHEAFKVAQRKATLRRVQGVRPERLIPIQWPGWSSMLWLGFLFLGCALLMPPLEGTEEVQDALGIRSGHSQRNASHVGKLGKQGPRLGGFKINPLSPTDMQKALMLTMDQRDSEMIMKMKNKMLDEILAKIGSLTEFELPEDVRGLVAQLSKQTGRDKADKLATQDGSIQRNAKGSSDTKASGESLSGIPEAAFVDAPLVGVFAKRYPDVAIELRRYYLDED